MTAETSAGADKLQHGRWLAEQADWLADHSRATELGRRARRAYLDRTQVRNLQRVAETASAISTLLDYVKMQIGKQPLWRRESFGMMLLDDLERLQARTGSEADSHSKLHLELCRLFVRQLAAAYVYSIAVDAIAPRTAPPAPPTREPLRPPRQRAQRTGDSRGPRTAETVAPAPEEQPADSAELEIQAVQVLSEQAEATIDHQAPAGKQEPAEHPAELPGEVALPAPDAVEHETATSDQAQPAGDVAGAPEPVEGAPANQEDMQ